MDAVSRLRGEYERCWPWLVETLKRNPTHNKEHLWQRLIERRALFWPGERCAMVTEVKNYPTGFRVFHGWLAGGDLDEIVARIPQLENFAQRNGCHRATIDGRRGWQRVLDGYQELGTRIGKDFRR